jgi:integrase
MKITIENHGGRLRLRWLYQGKRLTLSCGVPDSSAGQGMAQMMAGRIKADIESGNFDMTLLKYRPRLLGKNASEISVVALFQKFADYKLKDCGVSARSIETRYKPLLKYIERSLNYPAHEITEAKARNFKAILIENLSSQTAKERLWLLQSCWNWAKGKYHIASENPWSGLTAGIKSQPSQRVKPFTAAEIQSIIRAFRSSRHYTHYADFVTFLFGVGCRFGEASGLRWRHVADDFLTCWIGESISRGHRKGTKTNKARTVTLSPSIAQMLSDRHRAIKPRPDDMVFPSPKGLPIDDHNFRNRAWKMILEQSNIDYRKPYTARHSAISHALANGANYVELAAQTGHDKRILLSTYAHVIQSKSIFVEF